MTGFAPVFHDTVSDLEATLEIFPIVDLLVLDTSSPAEDIQNFLEGLLTRRDSFKSVIIIGKGESAKNFKFFRAEEVADMLAYLKLKLGGDQVSDEGFVSIPLSFLCHFNRLPFELYVKLSDSRYVRRIPAFEEIEKRTLMSFQDRGIQNLHFPRQHNRDFSMMLINNMINRVDADHPDRTSELLTRAEVFRTVKEIIHDLGLSPRVIEVCKSIISRVTSDILSREGTLSEHIERLKAGSVFAFHYHFIELTCYIGSQMLTALDGKGHREEIERLVFAAFFCDITLTDKEHLHHFQLDPSNVLRIHGVKEVREHAQRASNLIARFKEVPTEVATVIKQHHGAMDRMSFPLKKSADLMNLSKCWIISQELAYGTLTSTHRPALEILRTIAKKNEGSALREMVELFEESLGERIV